MLNRSDNPRVKNYKDLADECKISSELYHSLQPPCADSPTKEVINDIVGRRPTYSVEELFTNLRDMKRLDAIEAISCYFVGKDITYSMHKGLSTHFSAWIWLFSPQATGTLPNNPGSIQLAEPLGGY